MNALGKGCTSSPKRKEDIVPFCHVAIVERLGCNGDVACAQLVSKKDLFGLEYKTGSISKDFLNSHWLAVFHSPSCLL